MNNFNWNGETVMCDYDEFVIEGGEKLVQVFRQDGTIAFVARRELELIVVNLTETVTLNGFTFNFKENRSASGSEAACFLFLTTEANGLLSAHHSGSKGVYRKAQALFRKYGVKMPQVSTATCLGILHQLSVHQFTF